MKQKQPKPENFNIKREPGFFIIKNEVAIEYTPIITTYGLTLYNIYAAIANREEGNRWFISLQTLEHFTFISQNTIVRYNWLLEICKMISIKTGQENDANEYTVLDPDPVTPEILEYITHELKRPIKEQGKNWTDFKTQTLKRLSHWKKLNDCHKKSQTKRILNQPKLFPTTTNDKQPAPITTTPIPAELLAELTECLGTEAIARELISTYGAEICNQQLEWWNRRCEIAQASQKGLRSATGILRASIEGNWNEPEPAPKKEKSWIEEARELGILQG